jgi:CRISPR-associated protein Cmr2
VAGALVAQLRSDQNGVWPFEVITIGGDDVLLFVAADQALEIAAAIARSFEASMAHAGITLSAGVLIMPESTPVRFARDLVGQLLKHAKERSKQEAAGATIDFIALKAATMISETIADFRRVAFQRENTARSGRSATLSLTQRPYRLGELEALLAASRALADARFPRSQLYQLREIVAQGQQIRALVDYQYFVTRGRQRRDSGAAYAAFDERVRALCGDGELAPWRHRGANAQGTPGDDRYDTPLLDLIEIAPFVASSGRDREEAQ